MYGVSEELMQRMERRIKEKIYREMLEEEQKHKRKTIQNKPGKQPAHNRYKTQPNNNDSDYEPNKYENQTSPFLQESSTFLPIIPPKRKNYQSDQQNGKHNNPEYQSYVSRRKRRTNRQQKQTQRRRASTSATFQHERPLNTKVEDSEEEKTEKYLNQCEQIIGNLRELTRKNKEKISQRQSKYDSGKEPNYSPKNKSFRGDITKDSPYKLNSYAPMTNQSSIINSPLSNPMRNSQRSYNSWENSPRPLDYSFSNEFNDSSSFDYVEKERANTRKISPPRVRIEDLKKKIAPCKENSASKQKAKQNFRRLSPIRNAQDNKRQENEQIEEQNEQQNDDQEEQKTKVSNAKESKNELAKQNKRQKAIVKYLKKARLRGNMLYQKVQSRKGQSNNDPNADTNADPNADPNAAPANTDPNADSQNANQKGNKGVSQGSNSKQLGNKQ